MTSSADLIGRRFALTNALFKPVSATRGSRRSSTSSCDSRVGKPSEAMKWRTTSVAGSPDWPNARAISACRSADTGALKARTAGSRTNAGAGEGRQGTTFRWCRAGRAGRRAAVARQSASPPRQRSDHAAQRGADRGSDASDGHHRCRRHHSRAAWRNANQRCKLNTWLAQIRK